VAMVVPSVPIIPVGSVVTSAQMNQLAYCATFLLGKPVSQVADTVGGNVLYPNAGSVAVFNTANFDTDGCWSSGSPDRLTIQTPGFYKARYALNTGGISHSAAIVVTSGPNNPEGSGVAQFCWPGSTQGDVAAISHGGGLVPFYLYAGDYLSVTGNPNQNASQGITTVGSWLEIEYVSI